ncbi:hypothetical protein R6Q59_033562 [Mikania micrantha]
MMVKFLSTCIIFFILLLIVRSHEARSDPREYWRSVMKNEPMPKTIQDVLPLNDDLKGNNFVFVRNFDLKPNLIIYRSHVEYSEKNHHIVSSSSYDKLT